MKRAETIIILTLLLCCMGCVADPTVTLNKIDIPVDVLEDKIRGGLLGQILGNLNGLPHEMKYLDEPGKVEEYIPSLPKGAHTDDDTDIEWVYLIEMQRSGEIFIPPKRIVELWRTHINRKVWCANGYARQLMELGIEPPLTGREAVNPWSEFNISGQFLCEAFGLIAPAMPQAAAKIGLHYTHVSIDGEPAQTTQLFTAMIATAFVESRIDKILDAGIKAVDSKSRINSIVKDVQQWQRENPDNWHKTRKLIKEKYSKYDGEVRDRNGYELNTSCVVGALLYGRGDLVETIRIAFNLGWDADCNAATAGTIVGVIKGRKWMDEQGWTIADVYKNNCRPDMPKNETITRYGDRLCEVARKVILANGGKILTRDGKKVYRIAVQKPRNVERLVKRDERLKELKRQWLPVVMRELSGDPQQRARAAYLTICFDQVKQVRETRAEEWAGALEALNKSRKMVRSIFNERMTYDQGLRDRAIAAGLNPPKEGKKK